jgi:Fe-Mn family superoxide dismutase
MEFQKKPLPYGYGALEPYIDTRTMQIHHDVLYGGYVDKLNAFIAVKPEYAGLSIEELIKKHSNVIAIRHNAGGVFNHEFFFDGMRSGLSQIIIGLSGKLLTAIRRDFGTVENLKKNFTDVATDIFGSGYAWLCTHQSGRLVIVPTANQDTPLTSNLKDRKSVV